MGLPLHDPTSSRGKNGPIPSKSFFYKATIFIYLIIDSSWQYSMNCSIVTHINLSKVVVGIDNLILKLVHKYNYALSKLPCTSLAAECLVIACWKIFAELLRSGLLAIHDTKIANVRTQPQCRNDDAENIHLI